MSSNVSSPLILASASPRRKDLLAQIDITPNEILPANINEDPFAKELPKPHAQRLALGKAAHIAKDHPNCFVLGADTVVACGRRILPKAEDEDTARQCLELLSGRRHRIYGGLALITPTGQEITRVVCTVVQFKRLSSQEMADYLASKGWDGMAGGYGIQGYADKFVKSINGSYSNVVGLSLFDTSQMLQGAGYEVS